MTDIEAEELVSELLAMLNKNELAWLADDARQEIATGTVTSTFLRVNNSSSLAKRTSVGTPSRRARFSRVAPFEPKEKLRLVIRGIRAIIVDTAYAESLVATSDFPRFRFDDIASVMDPHIHFASDADEHIRTLDMNAAMNRKPAAQLLAERLDELEGMLDD